MNETTNTTEAASKGEPGIDVVRDFYDAVARGDVDAVLDLLDPLRLFSRPSGGAEFEVAEIHVWTVRDGKIVDLEAIFDTATVLGAMKRLS